MKFLVLMAILTMSSSLFAGNGSSVVGSAIVPGMELDSDETQYDVYENLVIHNPSKPLTEEIVPSFFLDPHEIIVLQFHLLTEARYADLLKTFQAVQLKNVDALEGEVDGVRSWVILSATGTPVLFESISDSEPMIRDVINRIQLEESLFVQ